MRTVRVLSRSGVFWSCMRVSRLCTLVATDEALLQRGEFHGVEPSTSREKGHELQPETTLSRIQDHLSRNFRVSGEVLLQDVILKLERDEERMVRVLREGSSRWLPVLFSSSGAALSTVHAHSRQIVLSRLCQQIQRLALPISTDAFNSLLDTKLENGSEWCAWKSLEEAENLHKLQPDERTFALLLKKLSLRGDTEGCQRMLYEMARRGVVVGAESSGHIIYAFAVRGHHAKADSLVERSSCKFGSEGEMVALSACARAAASVPDIDRLRNVLRRSVDENKALRFSFQTVFDVIWNLSEKSDPSNPWQYTPLVEQILERANHPSGFFRYLFREIERHISHNQFASAIALLEEISRIQDCIENQQRSLFFSHVLSRFSRQLIRSRLPSEQSTQIIHRLVTASPPSKRESVFHDMLFSSLMFKDFSSDERFALFSSMLGEVDPSRERPHLLLPVLAFAKDTEERLKLLFRASRLGYSNLRSLDPATMATLLLQPLYERDLRNGRESPLIRMASILESFGLDKQSVWRLFHSWWQLKKQTRRNIPVILKADPSLTEIQEWLRVSFTECFDPPRTELNSSMPRPTGASLLSLVQKGDVNLVHRLLTQHGWPEDVDWKETVTPLLQLYLRNEQWPVIQKMLELLSASRSLWNASGEDVGPVSPIHLLQILRYHSRLPDFAGPSALVDLCFELKRLFPEAVPDSATFFGAQRECIRLFSDIFHSKSLALVHVDECLDLLRTLVKLNFVDLHYNESITPALIESILGIFGWDTAWKSWLKLQSSLSCPNGMVTLLMRSLHSSSRDDGLSAEALRRSQRVLHKAQSFMNSSRISAIHAASLVAIHLPHQAQELLACSSTTVSPRDCVLVFRLFKELKTLSVAEEFVEEFIQICLEHTSLAEDKTEAAVMLSDALRFCQARGFGPVAQRIAGLFAKHGIVGSGHDEARLESMLECHQQLARRWIFAPFGFLRVSEDDEIAMKDEWKVPSGKTETSSVASLSTTRTEDDGFSNALAR